MVYHNNGRDPKAGGLNADRRWHKKKFRETVQSQNASLQFQGKIATCPPPPPVVARGDVHGWETLGDGKIISNDDVRVGISM